MSIQAVYDKYDSGAITQVDGVDHLADIEGSTRVDLVEIGDQPTEKVTQRLLNDLYKKGPLVGSLGKYRDKNVGIIAIRGTRDASEWFDDFFAFTLPFLEVPGNPVVHGGFLIFYKSFRANLMEQIRIHQLDQCDRIIVTGHSLGAAAASLCLLDRIGIGDGGKHEGCTFASPRVFFAETQAFEEKINKNLRVVNPADLVPDLPPIGFAHVKGGLDIAKNPDHWHNLEFTYRDGLKAIHDAAVAAGQDRVDLQDAEDIG
jgi:predicted lipase